MGLGFGLSPPVCCACQAHGLGAASLPLTTPSAGGFVAKLLTPHAGSLGTLRFPADGHPFALLALRYAKSLDVDCAAILDGVTACCAIVLERLLARTARPRKRDERPRAGAAVSQLLRGLQNGAGSTVGRGALERHCDARTPSIEARDVLHERPLSACMRAV